MLVTQKRSLENQILKQQLDNEKLYTSLFEFNPNAVFLLDQEGYFLRVNSVVEKITGYHQKEFYNHSFREIVVPEDIERIEQHFTKAVMGELQELYATIVNKAGDPVILLISAFPIYDDDGQPVGVLGIAKELVFLSPNTETTGESDDHLFFITEHSSDMIARFTADGNCFFISPVCQNILGYVQEELLGQSLIQLVHPDDRKALSEFRYALLTERALYTLVHRIKTKDGDYKWMETTGKSFYHPETGSVQEIISISRDITTSKRAEEDLRYREEQYRRQVEFSREPIFVCRKGSWFYSNAAGLKLLGVSSIEQLKGKPIYEFIHPTYHRITEELLWEVERGKEVDVVEQKFMRADGEMIDVEVKGNLTYFQDEPLIEMLVRDITEQKKTQELLQNSEKLTLVGQLAAGIAHEIRNPLTALKGFLQLIQTEGTENKEYFNIMNSELARIELIVSELLVLAKPQATYFQHRDLFTLIKHVVTLLDTEAIMKKVQILTDFEADLPLINCDENQLKQAFINFLKNGIEAMPQGGEIRITVRRENDQVLIRFKDHGCGIPEDKIPRLGEPFFTTKEAGTGLGLMVSNKIIQNHLGSMHLTSTLGVGTSVTVTLPIQNGNEYAE